MSGGRDKMRSQIKYGSIISYSLIALNIILGLIYTPWILHQIGSSQYGLYTLTNSIIILFLMDFGMSAAVTRYIAMYRANDNQQMINRFVGFSLKLYFVIMAVIVAVLALVYVNIGTLYSNLTVEELPILRTIYVIMAVCIVICFPVNICNGILNAYEEYIALKGTDIFNKVVTVIITIVILTMGYGVYGLVLVNGLLNILTLLIKIIFVAKKTPVKVVLRGNSFKSFAGVLSFQIWTTVKTLADQMIFNIMPSILAAVTNTMAITLYGFANVIESYVYTIINAINGMFLPEISRIIKDDTDASKAVPLMIKVGRINHSVAVLLLIGLFCLGKQFVDVWVGNEYSDLYLCILFICLPYYISASQQIADSCIIALNKVKYSALVNLTTGILNLLLVLFVIGERGIIGVCISIGATFCVRIILLNIVYVRVLHIDIWKFFKECHIKMLPATLVVLGLSYMIGNHMAINITLLGGWVALGIKGVLIVFVYIVVMWLMGWNRYEKDLLLSFVRRKVK